MPSICNSALNSFSAAPISVTCVWFLGSLPRSFTFTLIPAQVKQRPTKGIVNDSTQKHATSEYGLPWLYLSLSKVWGVRSKDGDIGLRLPTLSHFPTPTEAGF